MPNFYIKYFKVIKCFLLARTENRKQVNKDRISETLWT